MIAFRTIEIVSFFGHFPQQYFSLFYHQTIFEFITFFIVSNRNQIENLQSEAKINFLENEIHLPHGISNELTNQIQNTLSFYENRLLKLGQELINCDESSRQHETCLKIYNQFKV